MDVLRYPAEVRAATALASELHGFAVGAEELRLARMLMDAAAGPPDWSQLRDTSAEELHALIEAKIAGRPVTPPAEEPVAVLQLIDALKQSVEAVQQNSKPRPRRKAAAPRRSAG